MKNRKTILVLAGLLAVVVGVTVTYLVWRSRTAGQPVPSEREPRAVTYPPILGEIEPADGAVVRGADAWIRWHAPEARGQVQWRKAGEADFRTVDAIDGDPLLARMAPLQGGETYEYFVETRAGEERLRSGLRRFTVRS